MGKLCDPSEAAAFPRDASVLVRSLSIMTYASEPQHGCCSAVEGRSPMASINNRRALLVSCRVFVGCAGSTMSRCFDVTFLRFDENDSKVEAGAKMSISWKGGESDLALLRLQETLILGGEGSALPCKVNISTMR